MTRRNTFVLCGAPNLSFLRALPAPGSLRLPAPKPSVTRLDRSKYYLIYQSNEGDTIKNAYALGSWLSSQRGSVPISWGVDPLIAEYTPGLWGYYVDTATDQDHFFGATGGVGYTHPWSLPDLRSYAELVRDLHARYMPTPTWVDVWDHFNRTGFTLLKEVVGDIGFSINPIPLPDGNASNAWLADGTPIFVTDSKLWYPTSKHHCANPGPNVTQYFDCIEHLIRATAARQPPPFFITIYGAASFVDLAVAMRERLGPAFVTVGTQDAVRLGREAAPQGAWIV